MKYAALVLSFLLIGCKAPGGDKDNQSQNVVTGSHIEAVMPEVVISANAQGQEPVQAQDPNVVIVDNTNITVPVDNNNVQALPPSPVVPVLEVAVAPEPVVILVNKEPSTSVAGVNKGTEKKVEDYSKLPANAAKYLPLLRDIAKRKWPEFTTPSIFAAQTEKESCISLKHSKCWTPYAELKTKVEYGFGFGQITIAYNKDGSVKFNKFEELKALDKDLRNWDFADRHNAEKQFIALVVLNQLNYKALRTVTTKTETDRVAMMLAAYNGGLGGVTNEIKLCKNKAGCDATRWFGHVETTTNKSKVKSQGYGNSYADINRQYPFEILYTRREKYIPFFSDTLQHPKLATAPHKF